MDGIPKTRKMAVKEDHFPDVRKMVEDCKIFKNRLLCVRLEVADIPKTRKMTAKRDHFPDVRKMVNDCKMLKNK